MKRNWKDHVAVGKSIKVDGNQVTIVDVKRGPMLVDTSTFDQPSAKISGTLKLRVKYSDGREIWLPPIDGKSLVAWAEKQP